MSSQQICGWIDSNGESLLAGISLSALMFGILPLSALQSHIPLFYLGSSALSCLEISTSTWDLRVLALRGRMVCSPCPCREASTLIAVDF